MLWIIVFSIFRICKLCIRLIGAVANDANTISWNAIIRIFVENFELGRSEATESDLKYCFLFFNWIFCFRSLSFQLSVTGYVNVDTFELTEQSCGWWDINFTVIPGWYSRWWKFVIWRSVFVSILVIHIFVPDYNFFKPSFLVIIGT